MKLWQLKSSLDGFETLGYRDFDRYSKLDELLIQIAPLADQWGFVEVCTIDEGEDSDCPHFWDCPIPVFSEKAVRVLVIF
ncbi:MULTISPECIES: hypothetical protein [Thermoactinomyces]|uniref:Uncharacterized protein n=1 Tax=Thermoactinomyces daqus TaxID=1329516 RepID=A0A7W2AIJ3_9BACL|nr:MULTISPECIES: hypothetical protein [Thermoactinomyces]MBA4542819.1 hypothetical protein [Thermoactinomyces daqus]MBH8604648.1 hypothetical protein [Thermoactinomyces sp. CICC 10522]MBH8606892.1 hypothetical protein [Thermoactinomyces sp. CICC 10521]